MTLKNLSDRELLAETLKLRRNEHRTTLEILIHLNEIERRRLHLKLGYGSLFDYCTRRLGYSASAAGRRIQTARCVRRFPEVYKLLESEKVNLTTIALIARVLNETNKHEILAAIREKSQCEVEAIASRYRPPLAFRDRVKPVRVCLPERNVGGGGAATGFFGTSLGGHGAPSIAAFGQSSAPSGQNQAPAGQSLAGAAQGLAASRQSPAPSQQGSAPPGQSPPPLGQIGSSIAMNSRSGSEKSTTYDDSGAYTPPEAPSSIPEPAATTEQKLLIQFLADEGFMKKYEQARSLLSQRTRDASFAGVFDALMDDFLERHNPARRSARRKAKKRTRKIAATIAHRETTHANALDGSADGDAIDSHCGAEKPQETPSPRTRHIPAAVRDKIFARDKGRCTYVGSTGRRCGSTHALQIDHIVPFARGGSSAASNLRLLCEEHNRLAAEETFGEQFMRRFRTGGSQISRRE